jgi:hypothetical protein
MATLYPYITEGAHAGQPAQMKIHKVMWLPVGSGTVKALSDYEVDIDGQVDLIVYKGDLRIFLQLLDQDKNATAGPCRLQLNSHVDEQASYKVDQDVLTVSAAMKGKAATVSLSRENHGKLTKCQLTGFLDITTYLEPKDS